MIERPIVDLRILGTSTMPRVMNRYSLFATGNNIQLKGDVTRRAIICSLDAEMERPAERKFTARPVERVLAKRGAYIAACLTIVRAYFEAGRPNMCLVPFNSFDDWSGSVRSTLVWLGSDDPVATVEAARSNDPDRQAIASFISAMEAEIGIGRGSALSTAQILAKTDVKIQNYDDVGRPSGQGDFACPRLREALAALPVMPGNPRSLGKWLASNKNKPIGQIALKSTEQTHAGQQVWYVDVIGK